MKSGDFHEGTQVGLTRDWLAFVPLRLRESGT